MAMRLRFLVVVFAYLCFVQPSNAQKMKETSNYVGPQLGKLQGEESITINAPKNIVWEAIANSKVLETWGPPVDSVEVHLPSGSSSEQVGTPRTVYAHFGKKSGHFREHRTEHVEGKKIAYILDSDEGLGVTKVLKYPGFIMELTEIDANQVSVLFQFYHKPKGLGKLLNGMIKSQQKKNRHEALVSLKEYCESLSTK